MKFRATVRTDRTVIFEENSKATGFRKKITFCEFNCFGFCSPISCFVSKMQRLPHAERALFERCARVFATIRRRETGAMLLSLSAIYFLRRRCACESNVPTVRGR